MVVADIKQDVLGSLGCSEEDQSKLVAHLLSVHQSAEAQLAAAPRQFLSCTELYSTTVVSKREQLLQQQKFLKVCDSVTMAFCLNPQSILISACPTMPTYVQLSTGSRPSARQHSPTPHLWPGT